MISILNIGKVTDRSVAATRLPRVETPGLGMPGAGVPGVREERFGRRPFQALAVAAAQAHAYAFAANSAGSRMQHPRTWALRGLEPWSYPA
ncbi:hypothetical protein RKE29_10010 [Streptomyces sp. B1866]|uniref:hypothetical protein n=1 Tax=Streptomyces sp. B1866 TaxID=3075431 RepID=UPI00288FD118|nr:hypothetical protein [Streptomyces sp. B1866]MDT3396977.1 hypothetical protein [Streptomyces sp. B1866]